jgi:alpha-2-macroglobulin
LESFSFYKPTQQLGLLKMALAIDTNKANLTAYFDTIKNIDTLNMHEMLDYTLLAAKLGKRPKHDWLLSYEKNNIFGQLYYQSNSQNPYQNTIMSSLKVIELYKTLNIYPEKTEKLIEYLLHNRGVNGWRNTYESTKILMLLFEQLPSNNLNADKSIIVFENNNKTEYRKFPVDITINSPKVDIKTTAHSYYVSVSQSVINNQPIAVANTMAIDSKLISKAGTITKGSQVSFILNMDLKTEAEFVMIEAPIPAGMEYISTNTNDVVVSNQNLRPSHIEKHKDKLNIYFQYLPSGKFQIETPLLARYAGKYNQNPARIELMYFPTFYGRDALKKIQIK